MRVSALAGGNFVLPEGTELVSAVYAITVSKAVLKDLTIELQHCVDIEDEGQIQFLSFAIAYPSSYEQQYKYCFNFINGGEFTPNNDYGVISRSQFCNVAILTKRDYTSTFDNEEESDDDPPSQSSEEDDQGKFSLYFKYNFI